MSVKRWAAQGQAQLEYIDHKPSGKKYSLCYLADNIELPTNIGSFFRIADALGVEKIYLTGTSVTPPNSKIKKTSRSTEQYVAYAYEQDPLTVISTLKNDGYKVVSLEITDTSIDLRALPLTQTDKVCLVLGSERRGINQALLDASDVSVHIPMLGMNSSMNVASACAIATYELTNKFALS